MIDQKHTLSTIILAAGQGKRMQTSLPKILHKVGGMTLLEHVVQTAKKNSNKIFVVYGHQGEQVQNALGHLAVDWVYQKEQNGTGDAVQQVLPYLSDNESVLILMGDCPLIRPATLENFIQSWKKSQKPLALLSATLTNPYGYGRLKFNEAGELQKIVEERDASAAEKLISEVNTGIYLISDALLKHYLPKLTVANDQKELLLTDLFQLAIQDQHSVHIEKVLDPQEILGINDQIQLVEVEQIYQWRKAKELMLNGVMLQDPRHIKIRGEITVSTDVEIDVGVILEGQVVLGAGCKIGAYSILKNVKLGENVIIHPYTHIEDAVIENRAELGPYARIRPGSYINMDAKVGNFVELKKTYLGEGSKVNHLSYVGDTKVGKKVTIGAGTITCNYDGVRKHETIIEDDAFIGSNSNLVAPVKIGRGATIGAGSTITKNAPEEQLTLSRTQQISSSKWKRPEKIIAEQGRAIPQTSEASNG